MAGRQTEKGEAEASPFSYPDGPSTAGDRTGGATAKWRARKPTSLDLGHR
ncbi:MAG: hypothetical protein RJA94_1464 [Pseudomonadota bacterium]|jgi:hypothetical protein